MTGSTGTPAISSGSSGCCRRPEGSSRRPSHRIGPERRVTLGARAIGVAAHAQQRSRLPRRTARLRRVPRHSGHNRQPIRCQRHSPSSMDAPHPTQPRSSNRRRNGLPQLQVPFMLVPPSHDGQTVLVRLSRQPACRDGFWRNGREHTRKVLERRVNPSCKSYKLGSIAPSGRTLPRSG